MQVYPTIFASSFQGLKERKSLFFEIFLYLCSKLYQFEEFHDPRIIRSTRKVLMTCQSISSSVNQSQTKLAIFLGPISKSMYAILLKFGTFYKINYSCSFVFQMGFELQGGQKWNEIVRVNSVQHVRPMLELGQRTLCAMIKQL